MKLFRMLGRSIRDAIKSVIRNFSLSLASISCITITLIIVSVALIASFNVQNFTEAIEKDMTIVVFLENLSLVVSILFLILVAFVEVLFCKGFLNMHYQVVYMFQSD